MKKCLFPFNYLELEDFEYDEDEETYYYPCPCGDRFAITKEDLEAGEEIAECPSCSLIVKVYNHSHIKNQNLDFRCFYFFA